MAHLVNFSGICGRESKKTGKALDKALLTSAETDFQFYRVIFLELRTERMSDREADNKAIKPTTVFLLYLKAAKKQSQHAF